MTWETSQGDRYLTGCEAIVVRRTLTMMVDRLTTNVSMKKDERWDFGVQLFDELTTSQQLLVLQLVVKHLLTVTNETLELNAVNEAAVYSIFTTMGDQIDNEVDDERLGFVDEEDMFYWRSLTLAAFRECFADDEEHEVCDEDDPEAEWMTPISEKSRNIEQWRSLIEDLADQILWDRDFEMAGMFMDSDPAMAAALKQAIGVENDYYSDAAPDLAPSEFQKVLNDVRQLTHYEIDF